MMDGMPISDPPTGNDALRAWTRALARVAPFARGEGAPFPTLLPELAGRFATRPALLSDSVVLSYQDLAKRANRYAHWALRQGIAPGDVVCLLLANCPDYVAIWLGITSVRGIVALLNTNLSGDALAHAIATVTPTHIIVGADFADRVAAIRDRLPAGLQCWTHGSDAAGPRIDQVIGSLPPAPAAMIAARVPTLADTALYIYTSGTTGLPKAARVSHRRVMEWSCWFAGMIDTQPDDRMYNCLPLYHSVGGIVAVGAMLVGGGSVLIRPKFSASRFWDEVDGARLHRVPVYRRAVPLSARHAAASARDGRTGCGSPAATACAATCGKPSGSVSASRASWSSMPPPRAISRSTTASDGPARSGISRPSSRTAFPWPLSAATARAARRCAARTDCALPVAPTRPARRSAGSAAPAAATAARSRAIPTPPRRRRKSCATSSPRAMPGSAPAT